MHLHNVRRAIIAALAATTVDGALTRVTNFGTNPTNLQMNIYVPAQVASKPAVILAVNHPRSSPSMH